MDFNKEHSLSEITEKVTRRKCWWVYFDVDGYAPSDEDVVACATKELADEVKRWFKAAKDDDAEPYVVLNGKKYSEILRHGVEGYNWACCYRVREDEADSDTIRTSLAEVVTKGDVFEFDDEVSTEKDGVYGIE